MRGYNVVTAVRSLCGMQRPSNEDNYFANGAMMEAGRALRGAFC